jgi:hypothetical protein
LPAKPLSQPTATCATVSCAAVSLAAGTGLRGFLGNITEINGLQGDNIVGVYA